MNFRVGQKVVCVDATHANLGGRPHRLVKGVVYTVSAVGLISDLDPIQRPCIGLAELNPAVARWAHRFRPVAERKTDISIFTRMLNTKHREKVN